MDPDHEKHIQHVLQLMRRAREDRARLRRAFPPIREKMVQHIKRYFTKNQPPAKLTDPRVRRKIHSVATQIEEHIYRNRSSNEEYVNTLTLSSRIDQAYQHLQRCLLYTSDAADE